MLTVYIDFKSAGCRLGLEPIVELAQRHGVPVKWRPYSTAERDIPDSGAEASVIESHRVTRAAARRAVDAIYAEAQGIALDYPAHEGGCDLALGGLAEISGDPLPFIRAAFEAYWRDHADLDDPDTVQSLISAVQTDHSGDMSNTRSAFEDAQAQAEAAGVVEAPAIVVEEQIFIGRQHLPWVEEIVVAALTGN